MKRNQKLAALAGLGAATLIGLPPGLAATQSCDWGIAPDETVAVSVRAGLAADGEVVDMSRAVSGDDHCWSRTGAPDAEQLPLDVAVLYRDANGRSIEASELTGAPSPVSMRVAVRDRTAQDRMLAIHGPLMTQLTTERVGVPQLIEVNIDLPTGWSDLRPVSDDLRVDVRREGLRIHHTDLLFPPLTDGEILVELLVDPAFGVPTVTVKAVPTGKGVTPAEGALDREAAAVIAAITELSAEGAEQLADGAYQLADGADQLAAGIDQLMIGLRPLAEGAGQLADGVDELADGLDEAADGAHQIADGNAQIAESVRPLADGVQEFHDGVVDARDQIVAALEAGDIDQDTVTAMADSFVTFLTGALPEELHVHLPTADELADDPVAFAALIPDELIEWLIVPLDELVDGVGELNDGVQQLADGLQALADGSRELAEGIDEAADGAHQLADGAHQVAGGIRQVADGVVQLGDGAHQLADGSRQLADGAAQLPEGLHEAAAVADRAGLRDARTAALARAGARMADATIQDARGDVAEGNVAFQLTTAGVTPFPIWAWTLIASVVLTVGGAITIWWRRRNRLAGDGPSGSAATQEGGA